MEAASKMVSNKIPTSQRSQSVLRRYFGPCWLPNIFFVCFVGVSFCTYFWHRFWEAFGSKFVDLGVVSRSILRSFCILVADAAKLKK